MLVELFEKIQKLKMTKRHQNPNICLSIEHHHHFQSNRQICERHQPLECILQAHFEVWRYLFFRLCWAQHHWYISRTKRYWCHKPNWFCVRRLLQRWRRILLSKRKHQLLWRSTTCSICQPKQCNLWSVKCGSPCKPSRVGMYQGLMQARTRSEDG